MRVHMTMREAGSLRVLVGSMGEHSLPEQPGLLQVLSPLLLPEELHFIFGRVSMLFSKTLADAYARLEPLVGPSALAIEARPAFAALLQLLYDVASDIKRVAAS